MRFSIRELVAVVAAVGLGLSAFKLGGMTLSVFSALVAMGTLAAIIVGLVGTGAWRAFGIGFAIGTAGYLVLHLLSPLSASDDQFLSGEATRLARRYFQRTFYINRETGEQAEPDDPRVQPNPATMPFTRWRRVTQPSTSDLTAAVHTMLALLLGYLGGKFASAVFRVQSGNRTDGAETG
ncbi:hypothetical protein [Aeoliella sp.]|uniref:hypothetical protein n=1 Tax=Aeoliella sp. TaxID=2795800 RepID=UPI003CCC38CA